MVGPEHPDLVIEELPGLADGLRHLARLTQPDARLFRVARVSG